MDQDNLTVEDGKSGFKLTLINGLDVWKGHGEIVLVHSVM
jgi:hypothetical protein